MPYFIHDGHKLHYEFCGQDDPEYVPILLLHGNGENMNIFSSTVRPLLSSNCFYLLDSRLHGGSEPLEGARTELHYEDMAEDAIALMEQLRIREYDVVGFSDGGIIALIMAMRSKAVRKVITIGANTSPDGLTLFAKLMMKRERRAAEKRGDTLAAERQRLMLEEPDITLNDLAKIIAEVTVVLGEKDPFIKRRHSEQIAFAIPHGSHTLVPGAGHGIPETHPEELAEIIGNVL
ncbi:MAG: alpha/beta hydrolase [Clostridia bacterium]|nr:alpha/beta hydrolase [Clostridia bacterium]